MGLPKPLNKVPLCSKACEIYYMHTPLHAYTLVWKCYFYINDWMDPHACSPSSHFHDLQMTTCLCYISSCFLVFIFQIAICTPFYKLFTYWCMSPSFKGNEPCFLRCYQSHQISIGPSKSCKGVQNLMHITKEQKHMFFK